MSTRIGSRAKRALVATASLAALAAGCGAIAPAERSPRDQAVNFKVEGTVAQIEDGDTLTLVTANDARVNSTTLMRPHLRMLAGEEQEIGMRENAVSLARRARAAPPS